MKAGELMASVAKTPQKRGQALGNPGAPRQGFVPRVFHWGRETRRGSTDSPHGPVWPLGATTAPGTGGTGSEGNAHRIPLSCQDEAGR